MLDRAHLFTRNYSPVLAAALIVAALAGVACSKTEGTSSGTPSTTGTAAPPAAASASAGVASTDAATAAADPPPTTPKEADAGSAAASASATRTAADAGSAATAAAPACGTKPLPDCPTQAWMKANMNAAVAASDFPALATALDKAATFAPAGYTNWASIAKDGAKAARAQDLTAAKASCRTCHEQYKEKFKKDTAARTKKI